MVDMHDNKIISRSRVPSRRLGRRRPWPRPLAMDRGPNGADDRPPAEEQAKNKMFAPLKVGVL